MSALQPVAANGVLSSEEWERRLVAHYLRSDGPSGGAPLTFLDATPAEIALAGGIEDLDPEKAQEAFVGHFDLGAVQGWLSGAWRPSRQGAPCPGYFRYLVLTALVSATDTGAGETHNFRVRLGELLGAEGQFNSVFGVNALWRELVGWCDRQRATGEPFRRVQLPSYGNANLIGYAVRVAFPSWRDRSALAQIMRRLSPVVRSSPERLAQELTRGVYARELPYAVEIALRDFEAALRARRRMLVGHRFWRLAQSIDAQLTSEGRADSRDWWRLDVRFTGWEMDVAWLSLFRGRGVVGGTATWEGALQQLGGFEPGRLPKTLADALRDGVLVLVEAPGMVWRLDEESPPEDACAIVVTRRGSIADDWPISTEWHSLGGPWYRSGRVDIAALKGLRQRLGLEPAGRVSLIDLTFEGGIKTGRSAWLGRPGFFPSILGSAMAEVSLERVCGAEGQLEVQGRAPEWNLAAPTAVAGRWRVKAREEQIETERVICFERATPERWEFPDIGSGMELEQDVTGEDVLLGKALSPPIGDPHFPLPLDDILEAIYAAPVRGWSEADLIEVLQPVMPCKHFVWDFLKGLAEAEWLEAVVLRSWRARLWRLRRPYLRDLGSHAVAAGALGAQARRRLEDASASLGGEVTYLPGVSQWAVPLPLVRGVDVTTLAQTLGWDVLQPRRLRIARAPGCWPVEPRSGEGRELAGVWSFEAGMFVPPDRSRSDAGVRLERLVRERGDDRDVFRVIGNGSVFVSSSRTAAILEAHRRLDTPLFEWSEGRFKRLTRGGYLPMELARTLVARASCSSGPLHPVDGRWSYLYPADAEVAGWVGRTFAPAVRVGGNRQRSGLIIRAVAARRSARPLVWYEPKRGEIEL